MNLRSLLKRTWTDFLFVSLVTPINSKNNIDKDVKTPLISYLIIQPKKKKKTEKKPIKRHFSLPNIIKVRPFSAEIRGTSPT